MENERKPPGEMLIYGNGRKPSKIEHGVYRDIDYPMWLIWLIVSIVGVVMVVISIIVILRKLL